MSKLDSQPMCNHVVELIFTNLLLWRPSGPPTYVYTFVIECNFSLKLVTLIIIYDTLYRINYLLILVIVSLHYLGSKWGVLNYPKVVESWF